MNCTATTHVITRESVARVHHIEDLHNDYASSINSGFGKTVQTTTMHQGLLTSIYWRAINYIIESIVKLVDS